MLPIVKFGISKDEFDMTVKTGEALSRSLEDLSIVEIGRPFVKHTFSQTKCFASRTSAFGGEVPLEPLRGLRRALVDPKLDLIVCHAPILSLWNSRWWFRNIGTRRFLKLYLPLNSFFGPQFLRFKVRAPIAVIDYEDTPFLRRDDLFLLDRSLLWFKRELPIDHWQVFMRTVHDSVPTRRYRTLAKNRRRVEKFRPISLGPLIDPHRVYPTHPAVKTADIFFAGLIEGSSTVRERGLQQLKALQNDGYRIDIPTNRLNREEYLARAAAARLVWSPEGYGWDCFRHYETPLCWSVPLLNTPTIERYQPLEEGVHAVYYDVEGNGLATAAKRALACPEKLTEMAARAREHVIAFHMKDAIAKYVVSSTLEHHAAKSPMQS